MLNNKVGSPASTKPVLPTRWYNGRFWTSNMHVYALISTTSYYLPFISADDVRSSANGASASRNADDGRLWAMMSDLSSAVHQQNAEITARTTEFATRDKKVTTLSAEVNALKAGYNSPPVRLRIFQYRKIPHYQPRLPPGSRSMCKIGTWFLIVRVTSLDRKCPTVYPPSGAFGEKVYF